MNVLTSILFIILGISLNFIIRKYVKVSMVIITTLVIGAIIIADMTLYSLLFFNKIQYTIPLIVKLFCIVISILPFVCIKGLISHTIRILDYCINKNKLLEMGYVEKGIIKEIIAYGFDRYGKDGYYLIVDYNGEKIKSVPFRNHQGRTIIKTTYKIGDTIDVIIYNNKKYVKLKE